MLQRPRLYLVLFTCLNMFRPFSSRLRRSGIFGVVDRVTGRSGCAHRCRPHRLLTRCTVGRVTALRLHPRSVIGTVNCPVGRAVPTYRQLHRMLSGGCLKLSDDCLSGCFATSRFLVTLFAILRVPRTPFTRSVTRVGSNVMHTRRGDGGSTSSDIVGNCRQVARRGCRVISEMRGCGLGGSIIYRGMY